MALETGTYISDLVSTNPVGTDTLDKADDHLRLLKSTIKTTFPNITGAVTATHTELNLLESLIESASGRGFQRNRIINGDMRIDQRNAGASVTPASGAYTLDRWSATLTQASKFSVQQSSVAPAGHTKSLLVTTLSAYSVLSGDTFLIQQGIEGFNVADLGFGAAGAQSVTLSFWVRSSLTGTFGGSINSGTTRSYPFSYTISAANTWEQKTVTIPGDTTGTYGTTNGMGFIVMFGLGSGSTFTGTSGAWAASNLVQPTSTVSVVGTLSATWYVTGVQLEAGSAATPFERRQYGQELALCQRYYVQLGGNSANDILVQGAGSTTIPIAASLTFPAAMRTSPTITKVGTWTVFNAAQPSPVASSPLTVSINIAGTSGTVAGTSAGSLTTAYLTASAEL